MKNFKHAFFAALMMCTSFLFFACSNDPKDEIPELKTVQNELTPKEEMGNIVLKYSEAKQALKTNPDDNKQYIALATVFILQGRISGDGMYYSNAALKMLNKVLESKEVNTDLLFQAYSLKSTVLLNMHQFKDAKMVAEKGLAINGYNAGIYGAIVDADVELGNYDSAVAYCDKMLSIRPDLRSYSRASYLRQIHGDNRGAIEAMKMAVEAGLPSAEQTEWARVTLADLYMNVGSMDTAKLLYQMALSYRPNYPYAEMGLAKVAKAEKNYDEAIKHTENAIKSMSEPAFILALADLYELKNNKEKATEIRNKVAAEMKKGLAEEEDALVKHNANREMAQLCISMNKLDDAWQYANKDLEMRPNNIEANELAAWVLFLKKDYSNAAIHADKMLVRNTKNPNTLYKAATIFAAAGNTEKAALLKKEAVAITTNIDPTILMQTN